ncbi:FAD-dependent oxidoreductase [Domibacillus epiphyticus]|uniref:(2Fe-2S)-binding protein n=1 Tax=Domibacillus epiphyticus TaxID=1714355 RepID=A0A1V2A9Y8_9BACI|nr:FAD-dependent oxidoreductase [Domibacillus epiphyticus]OMP67808.1 (2Fe-2S)-binding protein [Domibacillus epiphyticus]
MRIPKQSKSYWKDHQVTQPFVTLDRNLEVDVTVVGGGITGIIASWLLAKEGKKVALLESRKLMDGTTGYTTAKVTSQHGLVYDELIGNFGEEKARLYYEANEEAIAFLKKTAEQLSIDCDFTTQDAYVYAETKEAAGKIQKEVDAYEILGINGGLAGTEVQKKLPYKVEEAIVMREQAQFHPVKFLEALVRDMEGSVQIFQNTRAESIEGNKVNTTDGYAVSSEHIIVASHFPFNDFDGFYFSKLHVERSYAIGIKSERDLEEGMYISADNPSRSLRFATMDNGEKLLIVGGENHPTGRNSDETVKHYEELGGFAERHFGTKEILYRWSAQDLITLDGVPYIGVAHENILVATGYAKWGMTNGTAGAHLLADLVMGRENRFAELYDPARIKLKPADVKTFAVENAKVAKELIGGKLNGTVKTIDDLQPDTGGMVMIDGKNAGAYKDEDGNCHLVDTTCTHMGCETKWNDAERTWDCPCHGSRYSYTGDVIEGPALKPLAKLESEMK